MYEAFYAVISVGRLAVRSLKWGHYHQVLQKTSCVHRCAPAHTPVRTVHDTPRTPALQAGSGVLLSGPGSEHVCCLCRRQPDGT